TVVRREMWRGRKWVIQSVPIQCYALRVCSKNGGRRAVEEAKSSKRSDLHENGTVPCAQMRRIQNSKN
ncbi:hypothetical protein GY45DRAFT_1326352, partial [Cubamyces sp. BRFM 1775]